MALPSRCLTKTQTDDELVCFGDQLRMLLDMNGEACQVTTAIVIGAPVLFPTPPNVYKPDRSMLLSGAPAV
jgi:hypothetical protein